MYQRKESSNQPDYPDFIAVKKRLSHFGDAEANIFKALKPHVNIVQALGITKTKGTLNIIMEMCESNLSHHMKENHRHMKKNPTKSLEYCKQVIEGLAYLHNNNICHRNLTPIGILVKRVGDNVVLKLAGFSLSCFTTNWRAATAKLPNQIMGDVSYVAPEVTLGSDYLEDEKDDVVLNPFKPDIFSAGLVFLFCFVVDIRGLSKNKFEASQNILENHSSLKHSKLISRMLRSNPDDRPTSKEVKDLLEEIKSQ